MKKAASEKGDLIQPNAKVPMNAMGEDTLSYLWTNYMHWFLAEGANYRDLLALRQRIKTMDEWPARWSR